MKTFTVKIDCENDAFQPDPASEVIAILLKIAARIQGEGLSGFYETIHDSNGNDVGRYAIKSNWGKS